MFKKFTRKSKFITFMVMQLMTITTALVLSTVSWFGSTDYFSPENAKSSVLISYFDEDYAGDGTRAKPYVITKPIHYYNLIYLQESGYNFTSNTYFQFGGYGLDTSKPTEYKFYKFDTTTGKIVDGQYSNYLEMNYYQGDKSLSPLGSATHPFVSKILGRNLTVRNLHIKGAGYNDIGVFGYVSSGAKINNLYFNGVDIDTAGAVQKVVEHEGHTTHENPHLGYLAGHVANENSFENVYVDNCAIRNSETHTFETGSAYGFFGECENVAIPQHGPESYHYSLDASDVYDYLDDAHDSGLADKSLALRDTENNTTTSNVSAAISSSGTGASKHYSFVGDRDGVDASRNYSLGTTGAKELEKTYDLYHVKSGESFRTFDSETTVTQTAPNNQTTVGSYMYYDSTGAYHYDSKWLYYNTSEIDDGTTNEKFFNVFLISYVHADDGVTYLKTDGSTLTYETDVEPNFEDMYDSDSDGVDDTYTYGDYFFVFKEEQTSAGVKSITDFSFGQYKIFCPKYDKYLLGETDTDKIKQPGDTTLVSGFANGTWFTIAGRTGEISYMVGEFKCGFVKNQGSHHLTTKKINGNTPSLLLTIHGSNTSSDKDDKAYSFKKATSLGDVANGSIVTLVGYDKSSDEACYYAIGAQASSNRLVSGVVDISANNTFVSSGISNLHMFEVTKTTSSGDTFFEFKDVTEGETQTLNQYLYAASSSSNHMKSQSPNDANGIFKATVDSDTSEDSHYEDVFHLEATGSYTHKYMEYNYSANLFSCYDYDNYNSRNNVFIYVIQGTTVGYKYTETATAVKYEAEGGTLLQTTIYPVYYSEENAGFDPNSPLNTNAVVNNGWTFSNLSKVKIVPEVKDGWFQVTGTDQLKAGEKYVFAYKTGGKTAGAYSSSVLGNVTSTFNDSNLSISSLGVGTVSYELQGSPGSWKFKEDSSNYYLNNTVTAGVSGFDRTTDSGAATTWDISIDSGNSTIYATVGTSYYAIYYNSTNNNFRTYDVGTSETKDIQLYRFYSSDAVATYFADEIKNQYDQNYDYNHIDVMGGSDVYSSYFSLDRGAYDDDDTKIAAIGSADIGTTFVKTTKVSGCILLFIPNNGSLDFGTLTINISGSVQPVFLKGGESVVSLSDVGCSAEDGNSSQFKLSLNPYNIYNLSYCALGEDKEIIASYGTDGVKVNPSGTDVDKSDIEEFVLLLGCNNDTNVQITDLDLIFHETVGNVGDFGTVGFRTAIYAGDGVADSDHTNDAAGNNLTTTENKSVVPGQVINFSYTVPANYHFAVKTYYVSATNSYYITFLCDSPQDVAVYIYNYDAERAKVYVRDRESGTFVPKKESYNVFNVTQSTAPTGGWYNSYTAITDS